ncbi:MAG: hypothetical protein AVDCRST_MAG54-3479, partial [uncultured Actinomycetospora sp.]
VQPGARSAGRGARRVDRARTARGAAARGRAAPGGGPRGGVPADRRTSARALVRHPHPGPGDGGAAQRTDPSYPARVPARRHRPRRRRRQRRCTPPPGLVAQPALGRARRRGPRPGRARRPTPGGGRARTGTTLAALRRGHTRGRLPAQHPALPARRRPHAGDTRAHRPRSIL